MKQILLMRHGEAQEPYLIDFDRPLTVKGQQQVQDMSTQLQTILPAVDVVFCSTAVRTRETLAGLHERIGQEIPLHYVDNLYHATADFPLEELCALEETACFPLLVGHNPGLAQVVMTLARACHEFPPAAAALLTVPKQIPWSALSFQGMRVEKVFYPRI